MEARKVLFYNPVTGEFQQAGASDSIHNIIGTDAIAGEVIAARDFLYVGSDGKVYKADASDDAKKDVKFIALEAAAAEDDVIQVALPSNEIPGFSGLTAGTKLWLTTAGGYTQTPPTANWVSELGTASTATTVVFLPLTKVKL